MDSDGRIAIILASDERERLGFQRRGPRTRPSMMRINQVSVSSSIVEQTRQRIALTFPTARTMTVATRPLESPLDSLQTDISRTRLLLQPRDRGTAPQILYALLRLQKIIPRAEVAIFPSHHYVEDGKAFMRHVDLAFEGIKRRPDLLVLLGIVPDGPASDCCWIEMGNRVPEYLACFQIRRFWETPSPSLATRLWRLGCLWNSSVVVAHLSVLLLTMKRVFPQLFTAFDSLCATIGTEKESDTAEELYESISALDFSHQVSAACPGNLAILPVFGVEWRDLGRSDLNIKTWLSAERPPRSAGRALRPHSQK
jgi:mannose-1-phosphate guanylyltransferase